MQPLRKGQAAPDVTLLADDGSTWSLKDAIQHGPVVLGFYTLAFTGG